MYGMPRQIQGTYLVIDWSIVWFIDSFINLGNFWINWEFDLLTESLID